MERQLPKNVRQIGNVSDSSKIYVEDYVDTFFNQLCEKAEQEMMGAFLVGETVHEEEQDYIFIYGAIQMKELGIKGKDFVVDEGVWKNACETCKEYFGNAEILGWFITGGEQPLEVNHNISKIHQKYFSREQSVFVTKDARDKEEKFYIYKYKNMMECSGHYVYYEKNVEMQNYMISTRKRTGFTPSEIIEDRVAKNFRSIIREKTERNEQKSQSRVVYALSTFLVLVILVIGVTMINNFDRMKNVQNSLDKVKENIAKDDKEIPEKEEQQEAVETVGEIVNPSDTDVPSDAPESGDDEVANDTEAPEDVQEPQQTQEPDTQEADAEVYIVKKGDTLESIIRKTYGDISRMDEICKLNELEDGNLIFIGQKLLLP